jgi:hypothetical protein
MMDDDIQRFDDRKKIMRKNESQTLRLAVE